jgi:exonuclease SbcC
MTLNKIILKNFRNHRSATFEFHEGVTGIIGGNGSGKSRIVEAVNFLFTGEGYGKTKAEMLTVGETSGYVIGHMTIDDKEAILERHIDTAKVNFMYDGKTYKKSSEVNELWDSLFQIDKNIVKNVIISNQGEIALLFNGDTSAKEKLFQKIFMVPNTTKLRDTIWNLYIKDAPPEYPVKDTEDMSSNIQCLEKLVTLAAENLAALGLDNAKYEALVARKSYLQQVEDSFSNHSKLTATLEETQTKSKPLADSIEALKSKMQLINIQEYRDCLSEQRTNKNLSETKQLWETKRAKLTQPAEAPDKERVQQLQKQESELEADLKIKRASVAELNKKIEEYEKSGLASGVCPTCGTEVKDIATLVKHTEAELEQVIASGKAQKNMLLPVQTELKKQLDLLAIWEAYEKEVQTITNALEAYKSVNFDEEAYTLCSSVIEKYNNWELKLSGLTKEAKTYEDETNRLNLQLAGLTSYDKEQTEFASEKASVQRAIDEFQKTQEEAKKLEIEIAANNREIKGLKQDLEDNAGYIEKNKKRKLYVDVLKSVYDIFHTGKFPRALIQTYSSTVTEYMDEVLASFNFPYTAKVNETFGIDVFQENGLQLPDISGGQQVMVGFSLRLALHNMFVGAFPFMIIDEGSYGLTDENAKKYFEIIKTLGKSSKFKQVIVIDHHSELSEYVDNTIKL